MRQFSRAEQQILRVASPHCADGRGEKANCEFRRGCTTPILRPIHAAEFRLFGCLGPELSLGLGSGFIADSFHTHPASAPGARKSRCVTSDLTDLFPENSVFS